MVRILQKGLYAFQTTYAAYLHTARMQIGANRVACPVQLTNRVDVSVQYNWSRSGYSCLNIYDLTNITHSLRTFLQNN